MMACAAATVWALLLNYLAASEGALSPPLNLSIELLDFKALVRWLPGPGNPKGTRYSLEFIDIGHFSVSPWNRAINCTNITSTQCYLILNQRILTEHFVRVVAYWKEQRSEWTSLPQSFQPYEYTLLSAPNLTVSPQQNSVQIVLSHPVQSLTDVDVRFSVDLFQMVSNSKAKKHIAQNITTRSSRFVDLPFGTYCINASAFLTAGSKCNDNATMCISLHQNPKGPGGKIWVVKVGVILLMPIPAVICLIIIYRYVRPLKNSYIPDALHIIKRPGMVLTLNSEELQTLPLSRMFTDNPMGSPQEMDENSSQGYHDNVTRKIEDGLLFQIMDEADQNLYLVPDLYRTAAKMEESSACSTQTEHPTYHSTPRTSFSGASAAYGQNTGLDNNFDSDIDEFDEENSISLCDSSERKDSSEEETDSRHSDLVFGSNYEPRPDPRCMLDGQFRSHR